MPQVSLEQAIQAGLAHYQAGRLAEAVDFYRQILAAAPNLPQVHCHLGDALCSQGKLDEAIAAYRASIRLKPDHVEALNNLGIALGEQKKLDDAVKAYGQAILLRPQSAEIYNNLSNALRKQGKLDEAEHAGYTAIRLKPNFPEAFSNLGGTLRDRGKLDEAIAACRQAIALRPELPDAYNNLGNALDDQGNLDGAAAAFSKAAQLKPDFAEAHGNLGISRKEQGLIDEALSCFRRAMALNPANPAIHSDYLFTLHFHPDADARLIYDEHRKWNQRHAEAFKKHILPHGNTRQVDRRIRIGYVSPDFHQHPVGRLMRPLLQHHDRRQFQIFGYSDVRFPDVVTQRVRGLCDGWRNILGMSDENVCQLIRQDAIDILVDLTMHSARNRLLVFARKPAPVQVTYLAYCSTTGLDTIDYRLTDPYMDGRGEPYSEKTICLPQSYWCYEPGIATPDVGPLPALKAGVVTFGCLNKFCKISEATLATWIRLLRDVPDSRLLLHAKEGSHRQRVIDTCRAQGIAPQRIGFAGPVSLVEYFRQYNEIDIAVDPFPWAGGTTTCDALWMGVPVVTLAGQTAVGRAGVSILCNAGLQEWIARSQDEYVQIASKCARDLPKLGELRAGLRNRLRQSPLTDARRVTGDIEAAYREMWKRWCEGVK